MQHEAPLTDLINSEPAVYQGMSAGEAQTIGLMALVAFTLLGSALFAFTGIWQLIPVCAVLGTLVTLMLAGSQLASLKRGKPDGHYAQAFHLWLSRRGWRQCRYLRHDGWWEASRSLGFGFFSPLEMRFQHATDIQADTQPDIQKRATPKRLTPFSQTRS